MINRLFVRRQVHSTGLNEGIFGGRGSVRRATDALDDVCFQAMVGGKHIQGSPFTAAVHDGPASAMHCHVRDSDLDGASLRDGAARRSFVVFACDKSGHRRATGGDAMAAQLRGPGDGGKTEAIVLKDGQDGTYCGEFTVQKAGRYRIEVTLDGLDIAGSPYVVDFSPDPAEEVRNLKLSHARAQPAVKLTCPSAGEEAT